MSKSPLEQYKEDMEQRVATYSDNIPLKKASQAFFNKMASVKPIMSTTFLVGVPIIQIPQDLQALQENHLGRETGFNHRNRCRLGRVIAVQCVNACNIGSL